MLNQNFTYRGINLCLFLDHKTFVVAHRGRRVIEVVLRYVILFNFIVVKDGSLRK